MLRSFNTTLSCSISLQYHPPPEKDTTVSKIGQEKAVMLKTRCRTPFVKKMFVLFFST